MIVYDEQGNVHDSKDLDYSKGYIVAKKRIHHHEAVAGVEEQGHQETIAEYPETGGKDVIWVVDVPGVEAREAYDEEEDYNEYVLYTEEELAAIAEALAKPTPEQRCEALENTVAEQDDLMAEMLYELTILNIGGDEA